VHRTLSLHGGNATVWVITGLSLAVALAAGALPLPAAAIVGIGAPLGLAALLLPKLALALVVLSIPFSTRATITAGSFDVTATDILVAVVVVGWALRGMAERAIVLRGGPIVASMAALFFIAAVSASAAGDFPDALKELIKLAEILTVTLYTASSLSSEGDTHFALTAALLAGASEAVVGLVQFVSGRGPESFALGPFIRAYGSFAQPNGFAGYLGLIFPLGVALCLYPSRWRPFALAATMLIGAGILASFSRGAWVGVALGLSVMSLWWGRRAYQALGVAASLLVVILLLDRSGALAIGAYERVAPAFDSFWVFDVRGIPATTDTWSVLERMAHWKAGWDMGLDHPILGVGPGNFDAAYPRYYALGWSAVFSTPLGHAHNYYINTFAETGLLGITAFIALLVAVFRRLLRTLAALRAGTPPLTLTLSQALALGATGALVTFCTHNLFDNMFVHGIGLQFGVILGLVEVHYRAAMANQRAGSA
jgi:O-antigen ligase